MSQIVVRGIPEGDMAALTERARRLGRSREQEVRELIARAAEEERGWAEHGRRASEWRVRLADRTLPDTTELVRQDRDDREDRERPSRGNRPGGARRERGVEVGCAGAGFRRRPGAS